MSDQFNKESHRHLVEVHANANGRPHVRADFGRITAVMGANGTGKSQLLHTLRSEGPFRQNYRIVFVEGQRTQHLPDELPYYAGLGKGPPEELRHVDRYGNAFNQLMRGRLRKEEYLAKLEAWVNGDMKDPRPVRGEPEVMVLFSLFNRLFPSVTFTLEAGTDNQRAEYIRCHRAGNAYNTHALSDGEKQVFCLLADLAFESPERSAFLVDEPELHLHPRLADTFWSIVEERRPHSVFIYATHSLPFALRKSIDTRIVLAGYDKPAISLDSLDELPRETARDFLGAVPAILKADSALAVEGEPGDSFDKDFYSWLIDTATEIVPVGSCETVLAATRHLGIWASIAPSARVVGVIDRDYRSDEELRAIDGACLALPLHEVESYLCVPGLVVDLARAIGTVATFPTEEEIDRAIIAHCADMVVAVALQRATRNLRLTIDVTTRATGLAGFADERVLAILKEQATQSCRQVEHFPLEVERRFRREIITCRGAVERRNLSQLMALFPGKELVSKLAHLAGCENKYAMLRAARRHLKPDQYPQLAALRMSLTNLLTSMPERPETSQ